MKVMICIVYLHRLSCLKKICFQKCLVLAVINKLEKIMAMSHRENRKILDFIMLEIYGEIPTGKFLYELRILQWQFCHNLDFIMLKIDRCYVLTSYIGMSFE